MTTPDLLAGRYRLGSELGRGGMGSVYEAHDEVLDRAVAVKMLHVDEASPDSVERFRREARILAGLSHPNIVTVYDFGVDGGRAWLVMRLLPGPTLQTLLKKRGRLPIDAAERYTREAAGALAAAHAAAIVHRDIKPGNLMLGSDGACTLVDLGIARLVGTAEVETGLTQPGMMLGTIHYLAPEVITGGPPTPASDVYALGGVLFLMLTGQTPFAGGDTVAALGQHVHAPVPGLRSLRPEIPVGLERLCRRMLAKNPAERPTAAQVSAALSGAPLPGPQPAGAAGAAGAAVAAAAAAAAAAAGTRAMKTPEPTRAASTGVPRPPVPPVVPLPEEDDDDPSSRVWVIAACVALAVIVGAVLWLLLANNKKSPTDPGTSSAPPLRPSSISHSPSTPSSSPSSRSSGPASDSAPPSDSAPNTPSPSDTPPSTNDSSLRQTLQQESADIGSAVTKAEQSGDLKPADKDRLDKAYQQLDDAVNSGNTDQTSRRLTALRAIVEDLHNKGSITDGGYDPLNEAMSTMRNTLDNGG